MDRPGSLDLALATKDRPARPLEAGDFREVPLRRILRHDNPTFLLASAGTVLFLFSAFAWVTGALDGGRGRPRSSAAADFAFLSFTAALMAVLCGLAWLRATRIRRRIRDGELLQATVGRISHAKGYSRVRFDYEHRGERLSLRRTVRRSGRARALKPGDLFAILVDPYRSRRVVPIGLYDRP